MRIAFIHDIDGWSFHNIGRNIARASEIRGLGHEFRLLSRMDWVGRPELLAETLDWADLHLFFWRFDLVAAIEMLGARPGLRPAMAGMLARKITLSVVYDHLHDSAADLNDMGNPYALSDLNAVCSGTLARHYASQPHLFMADAILIDGVDLDVFTPAGRDLQPPRASRVGWVGNSDWGAQIAPDMKGFHQIFRPALAPLEKAGLAVMHLADRATNPVPAAQMPGFYRDLDVLVCTSLIEGTPNPVLEAMASGVAVVSTDVGVVRDVLGPLQRELIINRDAGDLTAALHRLAEDRSLTADLKAENLARRDGLSWLARLDAWEALFQHAAEIIDNPERIRFKEARLLDVMSAPQSLLARIRRRVMGNRLAYRAYMAALDRHPQMLAVLRNRLRGKAGR